jgi:hypothetical protein
MGAIEFVLHNRKIILQISIGFPLISWASADASYQRRLAVKFVAPVTPFQAQQVILSHESKRAFVIDAITTVLEFRRYPTITMARKFQSYLLDLVSQIYIFVRNRFRSFQPMAITAAAYFKRSAGL